MVGAAVIDRIEGFKLFFVDPPHVTHRVRKMRALRVVAHQLRNHFNAGQAELVHGNPGDLFFVELKQDGHRLKWPPPLLHALFEQGAIFGGELQHFNNNVEHLLPVARALAGHAQAETGTVVRDNHAIAVKNQTPGRWNRLHMHPVVFRQGGVVVVLHHLQVIKTHEQHTNKCHHHNCTNHDPSAHKA